MLEKNNYAFIDSQNLNLSIRDQDWKLDFKKFRIYLKEKYGVEKAYIFIGYLPGNENLYTMLQSYGFICIFKPTLELSNGKVKGNVDAELVLHTMIQFANFNKALIVSGDGDFFCLVQYLLEENKLLKVLIPNQKRYSGLLKKLSTPENNIFDFMNDLKLRLRFNKNAPSGTKPNENPFRRDVVIIILRKCKVNMHNFIILNIFMILYFYKL